MKKNRIYAWIKFLRFLISKRDHLYQEFQKEEQLLDLLQKENVKTAFQPILSLEEGSTVGFEILNRPEQTDFFPTTDVFYDYVGQSGNVFITECFLRNLSLERFSEKKQNYKMEIQPLVFLNIQPQALTDPSYQSGITLELLVKHNLSPNQVVLELTERESVANYVQFEKIIDHYRKQGFRIAVDDAGTGYNSLQTLIYLKPEFIKLDKSLIRNVHQKLEQQHLVELLLEFAFQSGTKIIAEGIETESELLFLKKLGVHYGQGYLLGKPKPDLLDGHMPFSTVCGKSV
ncbi:EAL domain-containing protein (putative c-di-GMP-specific phosphodiesterase class I) [Oikeobacillus pervagus]|uniref:EAL domain-containing protein (Putative c-di-GMP-specific phosphodiesterase class I) n=1 Tax=Oikeobacillus pervagus TaxID=1325931 RepID=A0AAJ1T0H7_9BACI|nr:EAL domain-containing protein [Oikeobacillus pervagus]MDQ0216340.1 EAL domain-containing protein (putative c-di-GMP-specific phosphodiesterase class I) [Oikeobacillus pervagus]